MNRPKARRQTLGPVSVNVGAETGKSGNNGRRRQSVDPTGVGGGIPKARPPKGRSSMIPRVGRENMVPPTPPSAKHYNSAASGSGSSSNRRMSSARRGSVSGDRRQSLSLPPPAAPAKSDPRQISDKAFQQKCIKTLLKYLLDHGYDRPITHKGLTRPSGKDFNHIVTFLLRQIDPNFQDGTMKIEDEVSMTFKALGYPFSVSKTSLVAAGSPHAWPGLLAALTWLIERIQLLQAAVSETVENDNFDSLEELEIKTDKTFFQYLSASYTAFLRGDEPATEELEISLAEQFEKDDEIIEREIEQMTDKNAVILEQINNLTMSENDLEDYMNKRDGYRTDLAQFHDLIDQMDNHVKMLQTKKEDRISELDESNTKLKMTNERIVGLKENVKAQDLSVEAARTLQTTQKGITEAIERVQGLNTTRNTDLSAMKTEHRELWNAIEEIVPVHNTDLRELATIFPQRSNSEDYRLIAIDNKVSFGSRIVDEDVEREIEQNLNNSMQELLSLLSEGKHNYQELLDDLGHTEGQVKESSANVRIIEDKIIAREETLKKEDELNSAKRAVRVREAESMETKISSLRDPVALEEQMTQYERQCAELEAMRMKNKEKSSATMNAVLAEIETATAAMTQFDDFLASKILDAHQYRSKIRESYDTLKVPNSSSSS